MRQISTLFLCLFVFCRLHAQSETDNFTTYDTTIIYQYNPYLSFTYYLRISRPTNLFTSGSADTASRPAIFFMPGVGEMNSDVTNLYKYGPHYWLMNGWDGSVVLGNGTHYPILISMICNVNPPDPPIAGNFWVMDYMIKHYHIKRNGVHITGLSEGAFTWSGMLGITDTTGTGQTGADIGCREVTSMTLLSGAATSTGNWSVFGHWAQAYGGKAFLTVGYADAQTINPPQLAAAMNAAVPGSAYFTYNTVDGGQHGGWNTEYDPTQQNWQSFAPMGPYITTSTVANSAGTYKIGSSIFQWMLRQGDTTLVGGAKPVPVANAGSSQTVTLPVNAVTLAGSGTESGGTISSYAWSWVSGPSQYVFNSTSVASPTISNLIAGTYVFKLTVTDANGVSASANVSIVVNAATVTNTTFYNLPGTVQGANYASLSGVATGAQTLGSTTSIPSITSGESITYNVNVASAGVYTMSFQVASGATGAGFQVLNAAGTVLSTITVPNTSTLTTWTTVNVVVNLAAGQQTLKILSTQTTTWALNWFSSVAGSAGQQVIPGTIQAESYSTMLGVGTETTADTGGGLDVGWITSNDYMSYPVNVQTTGSYTVSFRVATASSGASLQLDNGSTTVYANVTIPNTGGWQTWTTVTATVNLTAGVQTIRVLTTAGTATWNLNWMSYALVSSGVYPIPGTIQSEDFASSLGVSTQSTTDTGGGLNVDEIYSGDWMSYNVNVAAAGTYAVGLRVASAQSGASFALESSTGTVYATVSVPNTGGWQTWTTVNATVQLPAGVQTLKVVTLNASAWNINWMSFTTSTSAVYAIPGVIQSENYASSLGVSTQNTADVGGGLNVDEIYSGDWMTYNVNVASAGTYTVGLRVASAQSGASFALESSTGTVYATVPVPNTGGWQTWTTVNATVQLPAGVQILKVVTLNASAWNINWMSFSSSASGVYVIPGLIQAEGYAGSLGVSTQNTADTGGGLNVDGIYIGDWMSYNVNVVAAGNYTVGFRVASAQSGASFAMESGSGTVYAQVSVPNTGGWQTWTTVNVTVNLPAGAQTLKLVSNSSPAWNINWMLFTAPGTTASTGTGERTGESVSAFSDSAAVQTGMLLLYPNPTPDAFLLTLNNAQTGKFLVQVITPAGRLVKTYSFEKGLPEMQVQVSLAGLPAGVYVIRIGGTDWQATRKVMKL
jgi:hypothetical protein